MSDKTFACADCDQQFTFTESEQAFYAERGFSEPRRCATCRAGRKAARADNGSADRPVGGYESARREMFSATCADCGREARVPFRPSGTRPVLCSDCFRGSSRG